ncbi:putative transcriptional activator domain protein [Desulfosarcina variabilis str. Montpellier]|uniref:hypothetical protein n=1 Tax=Desulfosarcina variabilis TaxID=2300 RepID=UPI003AFAE771
MAPSSNRPYSLGKCNIDKQSQIDSKRSPPLLGRIVSRERLFDLLCLMPPTSSVWLSGPGGSGKSITIASYLTTNKMPCLWYPFNAEESDPAGFFYHIRQAAEPIFDPADPELPLFTPEYRLGLATFSRRFFKILFQLVSPPFWFVLDNHQEISPESPLQHVIAEAIEQVPDGIPISGTFYIPYVNEIINIVKTIGYKWAGSKYAPLLLILTNQLLNLSSLHRDILLLI